MDDASSLPATEPKGAPPTGSLTNTATCCPTVSTFEGSPVADRVYGFDARTNLAQTRNQDEYWIPPDKAKAAPGDLFTQDGAAWVSVGVNMTTELEISFEGQSGNGCLTNCTFEQTNPGIVEIETQKISNDSAVFRLRGTDQGETSVRVLCQGAELGWVHVVSYFPVDVTVAVGCVLTKRTKIVDYNAQELERLLNKVFRQAIIRVSVVDAGVIDMSEDPVVDIAEAVSVTTWKTPYISDGYGQMLGKKVFVPQIQAASPAVNIARAIKAHPRIAAIESSLTVPLLFYIRTDFPSLFNGMVPSIGEGPGFVFKEPLNLIDKYATLAHELGHVFGLTHPDAEETAASGQLPEHLTKSSGMLVTAEPATNTEPAIMNYTDHPLLVEKKDNIMSRDPLNLMGYWPIFNRALFIRYGQWSAAGNGVIAYQKGKVQ